MMSIPLTHSTIGSLISWLAFVLLILIGLGSSVRFAEKLRSSGDIRFLEFQIRRIFWYRIQLGFWFLLAVLVLFSRPFSAGWTVLVVLSYVLALSAAFQWIKKASK